MSARRTGTTAVNVRQARHPRQVTAVPPVTAPTGHPYFAAQTADSPTAQWKMDETTGTTMADSSGNGHDGAYAGGLSLASTVGDFTAPHFVNDSAKHAVIANGAWMNAVTSAITLEGLYYADTFPAAACLFGMSGAFPQKLAMYWASQANGPACYLGTSSNDYYTGGLGPAGVTGAWYHIAASYDQTPEKFRVYINGTQVIEMTARGTLNNWGQSVYVGRQPGGTGPWDGYLAGLGWYQTPLSAARILAHAQAAGLA